MIVRLVLPDRRAESLRVTDRLSGPFHESLRSPVTSRLASIIAAKRMAIAHMKFKLYRVRESSREKCVAANFGCEWSKKPSSQAINPVGNREIMATKLIKIILTLEP
ncbi:hypothetical protein MJO28_012810 [Puccinia striiformis f. sp. tritici]|uniref:Uncharacterized protein n=1 Tax=Puccinia striiformis f. sp. tritici TaxID=168172 RepID=A0ACC0DXS8_9BASI|nr:hypothetical protein MJO28_012810 [Puccinia striiformis f. sp. tritici]